MKNARLRTCHALSGRRRWRSHRCGTADKAALERATIMPRPTFVTRERFNARRWWRVLDPGAQSPARRCPGSGSRADAGDVAAFLLEPRWRR
jgi:hypothetical protein